MPVHLEVAWTRALVTEADAQTLLLQIGPVMQELGVPVLYAFTKGASASPHRVEAGNFWGLFHSDQSRPIDPAPQETKLFGEPAPVTFDDDPSAFVRWVNASPMRLRFQYAHERRLKPIGYATTLDVVVPDCEHDFVIQRAERFLHLSNPACIRVSVPRRPKRPPPSLEGGPPSLAYLDGEHVELARMLELGLTRGRAALGGGWYFAHGEPLASASPVAKAACRAMEVTLKRLTEARLAAEKTRWAKPPADPPEQPRPKQGLVPLPPPPARPLPDATPPSGPNPDETVIGGAPPARVLPFSGKLAAPPEPLPIEPAPDAGGTAFMPLPEEVRHAVAAALDVDATQLPVAAPGPAVPFSGTTSPERLRILAPPPSSTESDRAGETAMVALSPEELARVRGASEPPWLRLREYAALRAALATFGEDEPAVLARFGLGPSEKQRLQQAYFERFRSDPTLRDAFESLLREEMRKLNRGEP